MAWKLIDLQNFSMYFDHELLGDLEGPKLVVSECIATPSGCTQSVI